MKPPPNPSRIPCAVLRAGPEVQLAIEARVGRLPVVLQATSPAIRWQCADGVIEELALAGPDAAADHERLARDITGEGLLVAELIALEAPRKNPALSHWILAARPLDGRAVS